MQHFYWTTNICDCFHLSIIYTHTNEFRHHRNLATSTCLFAADPVWMLRMFASINMDVWNGMKYAWSSAEWLYKTRRWEPMMWKKQQTHGDLHLDARTKTLLDIIYSHQNILLYKIYRVQTKWNSCARTNTLPVWSSLWGKIFGLAHFPSAHERATQTTLEMNTHRRTCRPYSNRWSMAHATLSLIRTALRLSNVRGRRRGSANAR